MGNRLTYYLHQGIRNIRRSGLIIVGLGLALSMVAGINYYIDASQHEYVDNALTNIVDINYEFDLDRELITINFSETFTGYDNLLILKLKESPLDLEHSEQYGVFSSWNVKFFADYSLVPEAERGGRAQLEKADFYGGLFGEGFYESDRFKEYFSILEGRYPKTENEVLVPARFAYLLNLTVGQYTNLPILFDSHNITDFLNANGTIPTSAITFATIPMMKIVGIYAAHRPFYSFGRSVGKNHYIYDEETNSVTFLPEDAYFDALPPDEVDYALDNQNSEMLFFHYQFNLRHDQHPFQQVMRYLQHIDDLDNSLYFRLRTRMGVASFIDREQIQYEYLRSYSRSITRKSLESEQMLQEFWDSLFVEDVEPSEYDLTHYPDYDTHNILPELLTKLYLNSRLDRIGGQLLYLPIVFFAILMGNFAIKTKAKTRLDEFLLLRSKGAPFNLLYQQFLTEAVIIGASASIIASVSGIGIFYIFRDIFAATLGNGSTHILEPIIAGGSVLLTFGIGMGVAVISSISSILFVRKLRTNKLLALLGSDSMDIAYDEISLFSKKKSNGKKTTIDDTPFDQQGSPAKIDLKSIMERLKLKPKGKALYDDPVEEKEQAKKPFSLLLIVASLFPLVYMYMAYLGTLPDASDASITMANYVYLNLPLVMLITSLSSVVMVFGIIRFLVVEKPSRFAKIAKFFATPFLKDKSFLCGLEMVRRKQFKSMVVLVGFITALLTFSNIYLNTTYSQDIIYSNFSVGADVRAQVSRSYSSIYNSSQMDAYEAKMLTDPSFLNQNLVNDVLTVYSENNERYGNSFFMNLTKYKTIIQEEEKRYPSDTFHEDFEEVLDYNTNRGVKPPGVIVSRYFLERFDKEVGDMIILPLRYRDVETWEMQANSMLVVIAMVIDFLPGIYSSGYDGPNSIDTFVVADTKFLDGVLDSVNMLHLIDINHEVEATAEDVTDFLEEFFNHNIVYAQVYEYNEEWDKLEYKFDFTEFGVFSLLYFDLIIIGVLLGFGLAILILSFQRENKYLNGVLLSRGFGKSGLLSLILSQIFNIFLIGLSAGVFSGGLSSIAILQFQAITRPNFTILGLPLFLKVGELSAIFGTIVLSSVVIYLVSYFLDSRKNITQYFHQF